MSALESRHFRQDARVPFGHGTRLAPLEGCDSSHAPDADSPADLDDDRLLERRDDTFRRGERRRDELGIIPGRPSTLPATAPARGDRPEAPPANADAARADVGRARGGDRRPGYPVGVPRQKGAPFARIVAKSISGPARRSP